VAAGDYWEMLVPSQFAQPSPALEELTPAGCNAPRRSAHISARLEWPPSDPVEPEQQQQQQQQ